MKRLTLNLLPDRPIAEAASTDHTPEPKRQRGHGPIGRDAFLYMQPLKERPNHGQCSTCWKWTGEEHQTCVLLGKVPIAGTMSCCLYEHGRPSHIFAGHERKVYTSDEVGLVDRPVRCENCLAFAPGPDGEHGECKLYVKLNEVAPEYFSLDTAVYHAGCCNANTAKRPKQHEARTNT